MRSSIGVAIEHKGTPQQVRHWTPHTRGIGPVSSGSGLSPTACGRDLTGMVMTRARPAERVDCPDCLAAYAAQQLRTSPVD